MRFSELLTYEWAIKQFPKSCLLLSFIDTTNYVIKYLLSVIIIAEQGYILVNSC